MLSDAQMRARCKRFMILTLNLLVDQIHMIWNCNQQRDSSVHDVDYESFDSILCLNRSQKS